MIKLNNKSYSERLVLSSECNFKCAYCYQKIKSHTLMSREVAKKRIEYIKNHLKEHPNKTANINLFGGEPLLNWDVFKLFVDEFNDNDKVYLSATTNGSLLTPDKIDYLCDKKIKISISLDGVERANLMRTGKNRQQTHDIIMDNINYLMTKGMYFAINMTIGKQNAKQTKESLDFFKALGVKEVQLQFMVYKGYRLSDEIIDDIIEYAEKLNSELFRVNICLLKQEDSDNIEYKKESSISCKSDVVYEKWTHTQADGFAYDFAGCYGTGFPDEQNFCLSSDMDLSQSSILGYWDKEGNYVKLKDPADL